MKKVLIIISIIIIIIVGILLYSRFIGTSGLEVKEYKITTSNTYLDNLKIVHLSDIHYGRIISDEKMNNIVTKINILKPDIIFFTGDLLDKECDHKNTDNLTNILAKLTATYGKYAVLGEDDHYYNSKDILVNSNFTVLENSEDIIDINGLSLYVGGIDSYSTNKADISKLNINGDYKIILVHEPDYMNTIKDYDVDIVLAGHSHNGQVTLPIIEGLYTPSYAKKYYKNFYQIADTKLYISSGIGVTKFNYRLFNRPSFNFYRFFGS